MTYTKSPISSVAAIRSGMTLIMQRVTPNTIFGLSNSNLLKSNSPFSGSQWLYLNLLIYDLVTEQLKKHSVYRFR